jgi:hypothetical protein
MMTQANRRLLPAGSPARDYCDVGCAIPPTGSGAAGDSEPGFLRTGGPRRDRHRARCDDQLQVIRTARGVLYPAAMLIGSRTSTCLGCREWKRRNQIE